MSDVECSTEYKLGDNLTIQTTEGQDFFVGYWLFPIKKTDDSSRKQRIGVLVPVNGGWTVNEAIADGLHIRETV